MTYSAFISGLNKAGVLLDRKSLAELAIFDNAAFVNLTELARKNL